MRRSAIIVVVGAGQHLAPPGSPPRNLAKLIVVFIAHRGGIVLCGGGRRSI